MVGRRRICWLIPLGLLFSMGRQSSSFGQEGRSAWKARVGEGIGWMRRMSEQQHVLTNQPVNCCFIGDSLTEYWPHSGNRSWDEMAKFKPANLGVAGDRTEQVLYRISNLDFSRSKTEVVVLLVGTNNLAVTLPDDPRDVVKAIIQCVTRLCAKLPEAKVIVLGIPPNGLAGTELRKKIKETNRLLADHRWDETVRFLPVYESFVGSDDEWLDGMTSDQTHFAAKGYDALLSLVNPVLAEWMKRP